MIPHKPTEHPDRQSDMTPPTRQRERRMQGFKSAGHAQRFLSAYGPIAQHFRPRRHLLQASEYRQEMAKRFESWAEITGTKRAAYWEIAWCLTWQNRSRVWTKRGVSFDTALKDGLQTSALLLSGNAPM
jgi:hypothetical protein